MEKTTTDHEEIKEWVEKYQGKPEVIDHPTAHGDTVGLRINFPGSTDEDMLSADTQPKYIPWESSLRFLKSRGLHLFILTLNVCQIPVTRIDL